MVNQDWLGITWSQFKYLSGQESPQYRRIEKDDITEEDDFD